jgi:hypothetical protein
VAAQLQNLPSTLEQDLAPQSSSQQERSGSGDGAPAAAAHSDGLSCHGLALVWRIGYKRILNAGLRLLDAALGPGGPAGSGGGGIRAGGVPPVRDLAVLMQVQRGNVAASRPAA